MATKGAWQPLADGNPPRWASSWGEDRRGVWAGFSMGGVTQRMRWIRHGTFKMGSPKTEAGRYPWEGPEHDVTIAKDYWLADTPCTQALWQVIMGENPSQFQTPDRPVEQVSFDDVQSFLETANERLDGLTLHLPSEAQWEYACRAGTETATFAGDLEILGDANAPVLDPIAWYGGNSGVGFELSDGVELDHLSDRQYSDSPSGTHPFCQRRPNPWGLEDMLGNVNEWCADTWHDSYEGAPTDGSPWIDEQSTIRVVRGGSWFNDARYVRSACRFR